MITILTISKSMWVCTHCNISLSSQIYNQMLNLQSKSKIFLSSQANHSKTFSIKECLLLMWSQLRGMQKTFFATFETFLLFSIKKNYDKILMKIEKFDETTKGFHLSPLFFFPKKINFEKKVKIHFSKCLCPKKCYFKLMQL